MIEFLMTLIFIVSFIFTLLIVGVFCLNAIYDFKYADVSNAWFISLLLSLAGIVCFLFLVIIAIEYYGA